MYVLGAHIMCTWYNAAVTVAMPARWNNYFTAYTIIVYVLVAIATMHSPFIANAPSIASQARTINS